MRHFFAVLLVVIGVPAVAQDPDAIVGRVIFEDDPNRTLISKPGWLRGLHFMGEEVEDDQRPQIVALIPETEQDELVCARITSISGNYEAIVEFIITKGAGDDGAARRLRFDSKFPNVLKTFTPYNSGIVVSRGACVGDTVGDIEYIATVWNNDIDAIAQQGPLVTLLLNMNVARADEILPSATLSTDQNLAAPKCQKIDGLEALAFNYQCAVSVPVTSLAESGATNIEFTYQALYRGRTSPARTARIEIGAVR